MPSVTVIISRSNASEPERCSFENTLAKSLHTGGCDVLVVPHVYYLTSKHEAVNRLVRTSNNFIVATWLYPRAARWTLDALGINQSRILKCHDLRTFKCPGEADAAIRGDSDCKVSSATNLEEISQPVDKRWYPVIDYSRCVSCKQCFGFCLFGVYTAEADHVVASNPNSCKNGCPACARVCPVGAIIFPHCDDAAIAAAPGSKVECSADPIRAVLERARRKRDNASDAASKTPEVPQANELEGLISALENLDD